MASNYDNLPDNMAKIMTLAKRETICNQTEPFNSDMRNIIGSRLLK